MPKLKTWTVTPWVANRQGGWETQPVILVEGLTPMFGDHPSFYIEKLEELHSDPTLERGAFYKVIGEFKDMLEQSWGEATNAESPN